MARRLSLLLAFLALLCLAIPTGASALGIGNRRAVARAHATSSSSPRGTPIAPPAVCPNQGSLALPVQVQEQAMRCMTDFARRRAGLGELSDAEELDGSAHKKSGDILRCNSFSHFACGREFAYWMRRAGYMSTQCWRVGENLAWGTNAEGTVRAIFEAWMRSPDHRENILGEYDELGISLVTGDLEGRVATHLWTEHFGSHCNG